MCTTSRFETHGDFGWSELWTRDVAGARAFYGDLFGWEMESMPIEGGGTYTVVKTGGNGVGGIMTMPADLPAEVPPHWGSYVTVDDVDATAAKVTELGGTICVPPTDIPHVGRFCVLQDPQGATISAITYAVHDHSHDHSHEHSHDHSHG